MVDGEVILSHYQAKQLLRAHQDGASAVEISPDLNLTKAQVMLSSEGVSFGAGVMLTWENCEEIASEENKCFQVTGSAIREIRTYSEVTNWVRSLYPTEKAPTTLVSGLTMHRIEGTDPHSDTLQKIRAASPVVGRVLDTATGLGYTAIEAAKTADHVVSVEIDPASLEIARYNPWSQALFDNPRIEQIIGHVWDYAEEQDDASFTVIIHDPPAFSFAGELYAGDFYRELYRILRRKGRLFHYIGDPNSKTVKRVYRGVIARLREAGFTRVENKPRAFGVTAVKT